MRSLHAWFVAVCWLGIVKGSNQDHAEKLFLRQLAQGRTLAYFEFTTTWDTHQLLFGQQSYVNHYGLFPKSVAEVISHYGVQEVHLTLTQGMWRYRVWGYPPLSAPLGAELWAWFLPEVNASKQWNGLVNAMSGLVCASLNFIDSTTTYQPLNSFRPWGAILGNFSAAQLRYASLVREAVCTENFTPWTKLLPCGSKAGLGTVFVASKLYDAEYHSLGIHFTYECVDRECLQLRAQLLQTLTVVFKTSLPKWSLKSLFSKSLSSSCPLASVSEVAVCHSSYASNITEPLPSMWKDMQFGETVSTWAVYDIAKFTAWGSKFDLNVHQPKSMIGMPEVPTLHIQRYLTGGSQERRGMTTKFSNIQQLPMDVLYLTMVPWFCRLFLHTLKVSEGSLLDYQHYVPAKDRERPHTLEVLLRIPPHSTITFSIQFTPAFLKWTEHPPDAHHGFYINSAVATVLTSNCPNCTVLSSLMNKGPTRVYQEVLLQLHTEPLLVSMPTPDFSMPYNVLCLVCTVVAIGFGSIFNLTTKTLAPDTAAGKKTISLFGREFDRSVFVKRALLVAVLVAMGVYSYLTG